MNNTSALTDKKRTLIFINIIITCIASSMLATALATALPSMIRDFDISLSTGQWLTSGYSLAMGIMMPLTAFLINRFPTRRLYLAAVICFISGLVLCVIAPNFTVLMSGRVLQACGNGMLTSMAQVILLTIYPPEKRGGVMGWYGLSVGAAPVVAPILAGVLVDYFSWRMIFYLTIAIMLISFVYALCVFEDVIDTIAKKFDIVSFVFSAFAFGGITLGIGNMGSYPFTSIQVSLCLGTGVVAALIFIIRQLRLEEPFLDLRILSDKRYALSVIGSMILYLVMMGSSIILPLYVQTIMGRSATVSSLVAMPGSIVMVIINPFTGKIYDKMGMKILFIVGASCMALSNFLMFLINMNTPLWLPAIYNAVRCASIGCLMMPLITWGTSTMEKNKLSHATALLTSLRTIAGAIGSALFVGIMTAVANSSAEVCGEHAGIHGLNVTFLAMTFSSLCLVAIAVYSAIKLKPSAENKAV